MDSRLLHRDIWVGPLEELRAGLPERAASVAFSGEMSRGGFGGSEVCRTSLGETFYRERGEGYSSMDLLRAVKEYADNTSVGVAVTVDRYAAPKVVLYEIPGDGSVSTGGIGAPIGSVVLRPGAVPEPYRRLPARYPSHWDSTMDPAWVSTVVRQCLPEGQGMTPQQIQEWERRTSCMLPPDVRAMYETATSGDLIKPVVPGDPDSEDDDSRYLMRLFPLGHDDEYWCPDGRYGSWHYGASEVAGPDPTGRVQSLAFSPAWVPLGDDWGGNYFVSDLAPGPNGRIGQILFVDHEESSGASWVAPSLTAFLANPPSSYEMPPAAGPLKVRLGGSDRDIVGTVTPETEVLIVNRVDQPVDLSVLAGHPRLRTVEIDPGRATGIDVVQQLPALEYLAVDLPTWRYLIDRDLVPGGLLAAGFEGRDATWAEVVDVANTLLTRWNRPPIIEHTIHAL
ncbi:MAG: SMI1/KNR4 family protein [Arachnia sp.]